MKTTKLKPSKWLIYAGLVVAAICCIALIRHFMNQHYIQQRDVSEKEIVAFVLTQNHTRGNPEAEELFIFAEKNSESLQDTIWLVDRRRPKQAWLYKNGVLTEKIDAKTALEEYLGTSAFATLTHSFTHFAILSIGADGRSAKIAVEHNCGGTCGTGYVYSLQRDQTGQWNVIKTEMNWIS